MAQNSTLVAMAMAILYAPGIGITNKTGVRRDASTTILLVAWRVESVGSLTGCHSGEVLYALIE